MISTKTFSSLNCKVPHCCLRQSVCENQYVLLGKILKGQMLDHKAEKLFSSRQQVDELIPRGRMMIPNEFLICFNEMRR